MSSRTPSSAAQKGILVVLTWLGLYVVGLPVLVTVIGLVFGGAGIGLLEIIVLLGAVATLGVYLTRRILRLP